MSNILDLDNVSVTFGRRGSDSAVHAVKGVSISIPEEPIMTAIAGESGSGKSTLANVILGMVKSTEGTVKYRGNPVHSLRGRDARSFRREVQAIFQDPFAAYNPFYHVDRALETPARKFGLFRGGTELRKKIEESLELVGLRPEETLGRYPHQLSGGQRQRIMIARAILLEPRVLIADEPVSMVDASLRASILMHLQKIHQEFGISIVYITHDLTTAYQVCDDIRIMYRGEVVEHGPVEQVIKHPTHEYTKLLVSSIPLPDPDQKWGSFPTGDSAGTRTPSTVGAVSHLATER